jgi:hypothetical protein
VHAVSGPYAAWASWLTAFGRGEDLSADQLVPVDEDMGPHMQSRVLQRLNEAFVARQRVWDQALVRDLDADGLSALTLVAARIRLRPLVALTRNPLLPDTVRTALRDALTETVRSAQRSIEDSVRRQPGAVDRLLGVVRENALTAALSEPPPVTAPRAGPAGRTVIL